MRPTPGGLEFRALGLPHLEERRRAYAAGLDQGPVAQEIRAVVDDDDTAGIASGHAAVWDQPSVPLNDGTGPFVEVWKRGAFAESLADGHDVKCFLGHEPARFLGRRGNDSLQLFEDLRGVAFEVSLAPTSTGSECFELVRRADLVQMSFAFRVKPDGESWEKLGEIWRRTIHRAHLIEISPVALPAFQGTTIVVGTIAEARTARLRSLEARIEAMGRPSWAELARAADEHAARARRLRLAQRLCA